MTLHLFQMEYKYMTPKVISSFCLEYELMNALHLPQMMQTVEHSCSWSGLKIFFISIYILSSYGTQF